MKRKTMKLKYRRNQTRKVGGTLPDTISMPVLNEEYTEDEIKYIQASLVECNLTIQEVFDSMKIIHTFKHFIQGGYLIDIFTKIKDKSSNQRRELVYTFLDRISKIIEQLMQVLQDEQITADTLPAVTSENYENTPTQNTTVMNTPIVTSVAKTDNYGSVIGQLSRLSKQLMSSINI